VNVRRSGLVASRRLPLAAGERHEVVSFGASLSLVPGRVRYSLGLSWERDEMPLVHEGLRGTALQDALRPWFVGSLPAPGGGAEGEAASGWRILATSSPRDGAARRTIGCVGLDLRTERRSRGLSLGYASSSWLTSLALAWNTVFLRRAHPDPDRSCSLLWKLDGPAAFPDERSLP